MLFPKHKIYSKIVIQEKHFYFEKYSKLKYLGCEREDSWKVEIVKMIGNWKFIKVEIVNISSLYKSRLYSIHDICIKSASKSSWQSPKAKASLKNKNIYPPISLEAEVKNGAAMAVLRCAQNLTSKIFAKTLSQFDFSCLSPRFSFLLVLSSLEMVNFTKTNMYRFGSLD